MANSQSLLLEPQTWNRALYFYIELKYQPSSLLKIRYSKEFLKNKSKIIDKMLLIIKKDKLAKTETAKNLATLVASSLNFTITLIFSLDLPKVIHKY